MDMLSANQNNNQVENKKNRGCLFFLALLLGLGCLVFLILWFIVGMWLNKGFSFDDPEKNRRMSVGKAAVSLLSCSFSLDNFVVVTGSENDPEEKISIDRLEIHGISFRNLYKLSREKDYKNDDKPRISALKIFDKMLIHGLSFNEKNALRTIKLKNGIVENLEIPPMAITTQYIDPPFLFTKLILDELYFYEQDESQIKIQKVDADSLSMGKLASLKMNNSEFLYNNNGNINKINISALALGGMDFGLLYLGTKSDDFFALLQSVENLDIAQLIFSTPVQQDIIVVKSVIFDRNEAGEDENRYSRTANFSLDLGKLHSGLDNNDLEKQNIRDAIELLGNKLDVSIALELDRNIKKSTVQLREFSLISPQLGKINLTAGFDGVSSARSWRNSSSVLSDIATWRLKSAALEFVDSGFMLNFYRYLDKVEFQHAPSHSSGDNIMKYYILPLSQNLENEGGLANLPVLVNELKHFFNNPKKMEIKLSPSKSFSFAAAGVFYDIYDIIEKLNISLQVNDRAPVAVAVKEGVNPNQLPSQPQPLNDLFLGEDIK